MIEKKYTLHGQPYNGSKTPEDGEHKENDLLQDLQNEMPNPMGEAR